MTIFPFVISILSPLRPLTVFLPENSASFASLVRSETYRAILSADKAQSKRRWQP